MPNTSAPHSTHLKSKRCAAAGLPAPASRVAERPHPLGAWTTAPLPGDAAPDQQAPPELQGFTPEGGGQV